MVSLRCKENRQLLFHLFLLVPTLTKVRHLLLFSILFYLFLLVPTCLDKRYREIPIEVLVDF